MSNVRGRPMPTQNDAPSALLKPEGASLTPGSARSLLMTILGELVWPTGQPAWTSALLYVLRGLGVEEQAARQAIARAAASDWMVPERRGREVCWSVGPRMISIIESGAPRVFSLSDPFSSWDGTLAGHPGDDPAIPPQRPAAAVLRSDLGRARQPCPRALAGPACRTGGRGRQADRRARPAPAHRLLRRHGRRYRDVPGRYRRAGLGPRRPARALPAGLGRGRRPLPPGRG